MNLCGSGATALPDEQYVLALQDDIIGTFQGLAQVCAEGLGARRLCRADFRAGVGALKSRRQGRELGMAGVLKAACAFELQAGVLAGRCGIPAGKH